MLRFVSHFFKFNILESDEVFKNKDNPTDETT